MSSWEVYWDEPKGSFTDIDDSPPEVKNRIITNVLQAAKQAGVKHIVCVDNDGSVCAELDNSGVAYTCIRTSSGSFVDTPNHTF